MATPQMKAQTVLWYAEFKSIIRVQREFRRVFNRDAPTARSIKKWRDTFLATGSVLKKHGGGRRASDEMVANVQAAFERSPRKSLRRASRELQIPKSTLQRIVHKRLKLHAYKLQLVQRLEPNDMPKRVEFANTMLDRLGADPDFMTKIFFSDEATFHLSGKVNRHNVRIWGSENPHAIQEHVRDSPKMNVWCSLSHNKVIGPFFFAEKTVRGTTYLDMLEQFFFPQIEQLQPNIVFQQDGAPPHWSNEVRTTLDNIFPGRWIGRGGPIAWPPRSPDLTPLDFFLWGYVKDKVYATPVRDLRDLRERIIEAIESIPEDILQRTWQEIVHRFDIVTVTAGAHIEMW